MKLFKRNVSAVLLGMGALLVMTTVITSGCTGGRAEENAQALKAQQEQAREDAKPRYVTMVIPSGTNVVASLDTQISTDTNHSGDPFQASTVDAIIVDGKTVVPAGSRILGTLRDVEDSGRIKGRAQMTLAFNEIADAEGTSHAISALPLTLQADSETGEDVAKIAAGGIAGAVIGGIAGGKKGAAIGSAVGAGAGTIVMLATKGDDIELNPGQRVNVQMTGPTTIEVVSKH